MDRLNGLSYLSPNLLWFYQAVGEYLKREWALDLHVSASANDPLEDPALIKAEADVVFVCGLPLMQLSQQRDQQPFSQYAAICAPVMQAERYHDQPVYFSDVVVRADNPAQTFADLAELTLSYNEPGSNSGYNTLRYRLIQGGYTNGFFGKVIQSGAHLRSLELILSGQADCSAIDSIVLEQAIRTTPGLADQLRVIESLGPYPNPPIAASQRLGEAILSRLQTGLSAMHRSPEGQRALARAGMKYYTPVQTSDYAPLSAMVDAARQADYMTIR